MIETGSLNLLWADALIDGLAATGISRVVLSPGSRSTPLVMACSRHPKISERVIVDERSAAFFALGEARADMRPVILIATSGTAPANWYPAVIEASQSGIPLILLTADRPPELQGCGANQTIDQARLFGTHVRTFIDAGVPFEENGQHYIRQLATRAAHGSSGYNPGPVHVNLPFREPLLPAKMPQPVIGGESHPAPVSMQTVDPAQLKRISELINGRHGLFICGPNNRSDATFANAITALSRQLDAPVLADPLSNLRFGTHDKSRLLCRHDAFLRNSRFIENHRPDWIIQFGAAPVSKSLLQYLERVNAPSVVCAPRGDWPDPLNQARLMVRSDPTSFCHALYQMELTPPSDAWSRSFLQTEQWVEQNNPEKPPIEMAIIREMLQLIPDESLLFSSNSLSIRQLDAWSGKGEKRLQIHANRGVSGIDGNISTLLGLAAASEKPIIGLLGDLAFYHDMNGLIAARGLDAVLILLNNGGGGIFGYLPQAGLESFEPYWRTPIGLDFEHTARLYGLDFTRLQGIEGFSESLAQALETPGVSLIEMMIDPEESRALHQHYWQQIAAASFD